MGISLSYEVYAFKAGNWNIDSVYDDKAQALHEAKLLLESRHLTGVKVIQEKFDEESGNTTSMVIFNEAKNIGKPKPRPVATKKKMKVAPKTKTNKPRVGKKQKSSDLLRSVIKLVLILGGICLGLLALVAFYILTFSS